MFQEEDIQITQRDFLGKKRYSSEENTDSSHFSQSQNLKGKCRTGKSSDSTSIASNKDLFSGQTESNNTFDGSFYPLLSFTESPFEQSFFSSFNHDFQLELGQSDLQPFWDLDFSNQMNNFLNGIKRSCLEDSTDSLALAKPCPNYSCSCNPDSNYDSNMASKLNRFVVIQKGKKKASKAKKINKSFPPQFKCNHCNCGTGFYSPHQQSTHHHKMTPLCTKDTITLLKLLSKAKKILLTSQEKASNDNTNTDNNSNNNDSSNLLSLNKIKEKYIYLSNSFSLKNHFEYILGSRFEDCVPHEQEYEGKDFIETDNDDVNNNDNED